MSFIDKIKYINQLAVVDEFGGRGDANMITRFYIVFRVMDENSNDIEVTFGEMEYAIKNNNIVLSDYLNNNQYTMTVLDNNPNECDFIAKDKLYKSSTNLIAVDVAKFSQNASICVSFYNDDKSLMASTTYLSDFPSCVFLNKKEKTD